MHFFTNYRYKPCVLVFLLVLAGCSEQLKTFEQGEIYSLKQAKLKSFERVVFVNYWAMWCKPCVKEMPVLAAFREKHITSVEVFAVNFDQPKRKDLERQIKAFKVALPSLSQDPAVLFEILTPTGLPTTVVLYKGEVVGTLLGEQNMESLQSELEKII